MKRTSILEMTIEVEVEYTAADLQARVIERTVADRVMPSGARLLLDMEPDINSNVMVRLIDGNFQSLSAIKEVSRGQDGVRRIVVEFMGLEWKHTWLYPRDPKELICDELLQRSKQTHFMLQDIQSTLESGGQVDPSSLTECKQQIDLLRKAILSAQQTFSED